MEALRVLELYSGIGGMHYALKQSGISAQVVAAIDINTTANQVYRHNFPDTPLWNRTIEGISLDEFNTLHFDMILMSPPCQPFTRQGLQRGIADPRTKSFLYILNLLPRLSQLPRFILLENVKGFETSSARQCLVEMLTECGYTFQEVMASPTTVGIPNSRLRYFLMAKISTQVLCSQSKDFQTLLIPAKIESSVEPTQSNPLRPVSALTREEEMEDHVLYKLETTNDAQRKMNQNSDLTVRQIHDFLEPQENINMDQYFVPSEVLLRYALILDIVKPTCRRSICFTKGYGRYVEGTGSVLQCCLETEIESVFKNLDQLLEEEKVQQLLRLKLRYFTPKEVANIMGFPESFLPSACCVFQVTSCQVIFTSAPKLSMSCQVCPHFSRHVCPPSSRQVCPPSSRQVISTPCPVFSRSVCHEAHPPRSLQRRKRLQNRKSKTEKTEAATKYLTANCKFMDNIIHGDVVLADREFDIRELIALVGAEVFYPAFRKGMEQLAAAEVEETRKIMTLKIHDERVHNWN
ncbi:tRNA (cytosine(38)-C(5))-methyltransferase isoform X2 [Festucalex cinctus]